MQSKLDEGRHSEAKVLCRRLVRSYRDQAAAWQAAGACSLGSGNLRLAVSQLRRAVELAPTVPAFSESLGVALGVVGRWDQAREWLHKAHALSPGDAQIRSRLALTCLRGGRPEEAIALLETMETPSGLDRLCLAESYARRAGALSAAGRFTDCIQAYQQALSYAPEEPAILANLGAACCQNGALETGLDVLRRAVSLAPGYTPAGSNLLLALNHHAGASPKDVFREHQRIGREVERRAAPPAPYPNRTAAERPLRIGYVSSDFRGYSAAAFFTPLLAAANRRHFRPYCYYNGRRVDTVTRKLRGLAGVWRVIANLNDEEAERQIRADRIDILVDLAGHTAGNRLDLFARRPAPVQVTYLGYPNTTGLAAIGYRLTDAVADPEGAERQHTEQLVRLPGCFLCYRPPAVAPAVGPAPCQRTPWVTFGSLNRLPKLNPTLLETWAEILRRTPESRLLLKCRAFDDAAATSRMRATFAGLGISPDRLVLLGHVATQRDHMAVYHQIDIALDSFPYHGTTTTCEALWMGVPVVTEAGGTHASRVGVSLLAAAGLSEWIAAGREPYIRTAVELACNRGRIADLRRTLRGQVARSPLCQEAAFTAKVEAFYREAWRKWCAAR